MADLPRVESECVDDTVQRYESLTTSDVVSQAPSSDPEIARLLQENSAGSTPIGVPIFLGHGTADEQVPPELSDRLAAKYCALNVAVMQRIYDGEDHDGVVDAAADDVLAFITARYSHDPATTDCT